MIATPNDGEDEGVGVTSDNITILNSAPSAECAARRMNPSRKSMTSSLPSIPIAAMPMKTSSPTPTHGRGMAAASRDQQHGPASETSADETYRCTVTPNDGEEDDDSDQHGERPDMLRTHRTLAGVRICSG